MFPNGKDFYRSATQQNNSLKNILRPKHSGIAVLAFIIIEEKMSTCV